MKLREKLLFLLKIRGFSQEMLARELNVSFPTMNSWINEKSVPRKKALERIDDLFLKYTGQKKIPESLLDAKKELVYGKLKNYKNILDMILKNKDIYDEFLLKLTYNTNSIEGSTLTEAETSIILFDDVSLPNKAFREQLEVKNHQTAWEYLLDYLKGSSKIDENLILKLHSILMNGLLSNAGLYRKHGVRIVGANVPTANYIKIPNLMFDLVSKIARRTKDQIGLVSEIHADFEQIHPFLDGNGRIGRLVMNAMLLRSNLSPALIRQENKQLYYTYLNKSQIDNDYSLLEDFVCDAVLDGFDLLGRIGKY